MKLDLGMTLMGGSNKKDQSYIHITRKDVKKRVNEHPAIDPWTRDYLIKRIDQYPDDALIFFVKNINEIVIAALNERSKALKEQNEIRESDIRQQEDSGQSRAGISEVERESLFSRD